jgi:glycoprotein endo-alpha-1,2-mannosidase
MKRFFAIAFLFLIVSCTGNVKDQEILGTWNYLANDASYGYQVGKVIFYEEGGITKVKVEIQGSSINAMNLIVEGNNVAFSVLVEHEQSSVKLELKDNKLVGEVLSSEGAISIAMVKEETILGTWNYTVNDAPFGFQTGKVIFYEEDDTTKAKIKIYGFLMDTENLLIDGTNVSLTSHVEHEQISIILEMVSNQLVGEVRASEGAMSIVMVKKGSKTDVDTDDIENKTDKSVAQAIALEGIGRTNLLDEVSSTNVVDYNVHTFYYGWYANPETDGKYSNWNHPVIKHWIDTTWDNAGQYPGGDDIGANFFPQLGSYSSSDEEIIDSHMQQIRDAGIGVVAISWWGKGHFTNKSVHTLLDIAHKYGLKLAFHIEPIYKTVAEFRGHLEYISANYAQHPALYKVNGKPMYYLYNSFNLKYHEWQSMLHPDSLSTIRKTPLDGIFIGLWTTGFDGEFIVKSCFDGFYTYFASDGFAYGSTTSNWPDMSAFAHENNLIYIPSVGPGYIDTRIRPWNEKNTKSRDKGRYYEKMYAHAVNTSADFISITSFNEWHEGTQIEPAIPKKLASYTYEDYGAATDPLFYIKKTRELVRKYEKRGEPALIE